MSAPRRLSVADVAERAGVDPRTVRSYAARGYLPAGTPCPCCGLGPTWEPAEIGRWLANRPGQGRRRAVTEPREGGRPTMTGRAT